MRTTPILPGEYYHIFNRSNDKQDIFHDIGDWSRFLFLVLHIQSTETIYNIGRLVEHRASNINSDKLEKIIKNRTVELINFALMPNHFHLTVKEIAEGGISQYMQRVLNAYTKYYNAKHNKFGHLFQGPYKIVHIEDNRQLLHLSAYIHRNPRALKEWRQKEDKYPWSSYQDYVDENRWGDLLSPNMILDQFESKREYHNFVKTSTAKMLDAELLTFQH